MIQDTLGNRLLALADILIKGVSFLLVLFLIVLMIIGAPMTMLGGVAMLTADLAFGGPSTSAAPARPAATDFDLDTSVDLPHLVQVGTVHGTQLFQ